MGFIKRLKLGLGLLAASGCVQAQTPISYSEQLIETTKVWSSVVADFNKDGHDDLFIHGHDPLDRIWYWTATGYTPAKQVLASTDRHACTVADFNQDTLLDIFCSVGADQGESTKLNELYFQGKARLFTKQTNFGAEDIYGRGRRPIAFDMNHDSYPDLYLSNYTAPRPDGQPNINQVFINQAGQGFLPITTTASGALGSLCLAKGDINQDGWDDLVVCNKEGVAHLLLNNTAGDFIDLPLSYLKSQYWLDAKLVDVNKDGRDDLVVITATRTLQVLLNTGTGRYFPSVKFQATLPGNPVSLAVADVNGDGNKDIYVVLRDSFCTFTGIDLLPDLLFLGQGAGRWTRNDLQQNYNGCGHRADVVDGDKILLMNGGPDWEGPSYILGFK